MTDTCYACSINAQLDSLPAREDVFAADGWRVAHAIDVALEGWLVLVPLRHVTSLNDLTPGEAAAFGPLLRRASLALTEVFGAQKSYFMFFAEKEGFSHFHVHVVPRMDWFSDDQQGPRVFSFMAGHASGFVDEQRRDEIAQRLRAAMTASE